MIILSTHLDDAVFSCYSLLTPQTTVLTVFAGVPPPGTLGSWDAQDPSVDDSHTRMLQRREEDRQALARSGAQALHLDLLESQYAHVCQPADQKTIVSAIAPVLSRTDQVVAPAGFGNPEHAFVRDAVLRLRPACDFYADLPFAKNDNCRPPSGMPAAGKSRSVRLEGDLLAQKLASCLEYKSQVPQLRRLLGDFFDAEHLGREVLWQRVPGSCAGGGPRIALDS